MNTQTGDYVQLEVRPAAVLTNSYVAGTVIGSESLTGHTYLQNQILLYVSLILGALASAELIVEFSPDGITYYQETVSSITGSVSSDTILEHQFTTEDNFRLAFPAKDKFVRVSVKGTGVVTGSLMSVIAIIGAI